MPRRYDPSLKPLARALRVGMTLAETHLWHRINRNQLRGVRFNRQKPIGPYIVDFYCASSKLVIEVDGGQHYRAEGRESDAKRDAYLAGIGLKVLRFSDRDVLTRTDGVLQETYKHLVAPETEIR